MDRPPLGVMPRWIHQDRRRIDLAEAIRRYVQQDDIPMLIPMEWVTEYNELTEIMRKRLYGEEATHA